MANEDMIVATALSNKGGAGKTMLTKIFGSSALANAQRTLFLDTDGNMSLIEWAERAQANGVWPDNAQARWVGTLEDVQAAVDDAYEQDTADFVFVDTAGFGADELDHIVMLSDYLFSPVKVSETDFGAAKRALEWYENLTLRIEAEDGIPSLAFVVNDVPAKLNASQAAILPALRKALPTIPTSVPSRAAYSAMDRSGPLMNLVEQLDALSDAKQKIQVGHIFAGLELGTVTLNEILTEARYG